MIVQLAGPGNVFVALFRSHCSEPRLRSLLCGSPADVQEDCFNLACTRQHLQGLPAEKLLNLQPLQILNEAEVQRASKYLDDWSCSVKAKCSYEDLICHLGDNPNQWRTWSAVSGACPTLRRGGGVMFSPAAGRQCLLKELYMGMGFPTFRGLADAAGVPLYQVFKPLQGLSYAHMRQALGNSQVVPQVGVFALCALASARLQDA